jgi:hypothetical protein
VDQIRRALRVSRVVQVDACQHLTSLGELTH